MGIIKISSFAVIVLCITFRGQSYKNKFIILPDWLVIGYDLLYIRWAICLCQNQTKKSYAKNDLLQFEDENEMTKISSLKSFNIFKRPIVVSKNKVAPANSS